MSDTPIKRSRKRVIRREQLPANKLAATKKPPVKPKPKRKPSSTAKKAENPPSAIRAEALNTSLNAFEVWRTYQPLALGIEKQIYRFTSQEQLSSSKRVVQKLLRQHCSDSRYRQAVQAGQVRLNLDGTQAEPVGITINE